MSASQIKALREFNARAIEDIYRPIETHSSIFRRILKLRQGRRVRDEADRIQKYMNYQYTGLVPCAFVEQ